METATEQYIEVKGRIVGNSQIEHQSQSSVIGAPGSEVRNFATVIVQNKPDRPFVVDVTSLDADSFLPQTDVKIRIYKD